MAILGQFRRDTLANWQANNPIIADGEFVLIALDPNNPTQYTYWKCGDGVSNFNDLPQYGLAGSGISGITNDYGTSASLASSQDLLTKGLNNYNISSNNSNTNYTNKATARALLPTALQKRGMKITYLFNNKWITEEFIGTTFSTDNEYWREDVTDLTTGYFTCGTLGNIAAKTVDAGNQFALTNNIRLLIKFTYAHTDTQNNPTLNISGTGAHAIYYNGAVASSTNTWAQNEVVDVYYDGSNFVCSTQGGAQFSTGEKVGDVGIDNEPTAGSDNLVKSGGIYKIDENNKAFSQILSETIGIKGPSKFIGNINSSGNWVNVANPIVTFYLFNISPNDTLTITSGNLSTVYAFLKNYQTPVQGTPADFCSGTSRESIPARTTVTLSVPSDAKFLYIYHTSSDGTDYSPNSVLINSKEFIKDNLTEKTDKLVNNVDILNATVDDNIAFHYKLNGTNDSYVNFNKPISLKSDGDSIEILCKPLLSNDTTSFAFASSGLSSNNYYAIKLDRRLVGIRSVDGTWIYTGTLTNSKIIKLKLEYRESKIFIYRNNVLISTYNSQKEIQVSSLGNGGNGTYGYWSGEVYYVKYNNLDYLNPLYASNSNNCILMQSPKNLPKGVLKFVYDVATPYFVFYSRLGNTNKYFSFVVGLSVDNDDLVYLKEWRLSSGGYYEYINGTFVKLYDTLYVNENEMTMAISGAIDHTGGVHGDERVDVDSSCFVEFFADGQKIENLTSDFELECESFYYIQKSTLHQTSDTQGTFVPGHPIIAYHLKKNLFKECGFELENTVQFLTEQRVNIYYAGLVCVCKDAANYALIPPIILTPELTGTNNYIYSTDLKASEVIMWNPNNGLKTSVSGIILEGYDDASEITQFMIWDRVADTKYYRRVNVNKTFSINDVIRNRVIVKFY